MAASPSIETRLMQSWQRRGALACALWPLSLLFGAIVAARRGLYRSAMLPVTRLPVPVVVVGNIFIGGTGKTPFAIWLIGALRAAGYHPGLISRGHGAKQDAPRSVTPASRAQEVGDEPLLIAGRTGAPVMVGRDRVAAAKALLQAHPEVDLIIADDGLQHYALGRDLEILLFDARGAGNGWLLPAGPLREPCSRRRDFTVINGAPAAANEHAMQLTGQFAERLSSRLERVPLSRLPPGRLLAAAGIGNPQRFFTLLRAAGLAPEEMALPDHYAYTDDPFAGHPADIILITEKDAVKCWQNPALALDPRLWVVPVDAQLAPLLAEQIVEKLRGYPTA